MVTFTARRGRCESDHDPLDHLHVGVPVRIQLPAHDGIPYGDLRCLGRDDNRLARARDLLCLPV